MFRVPDCMPKAKPPATARWLLAPAAPGAGRTPRREERETLHQRKNGDRLLGNQPEKSTDGDTDMRRFHRRQWHRLFRALGPVFAAALSACAASGPTPPPPNPLINACQQPGQQTIPGARADATLDKVRVWSGTNWGFDAINSQACLTVAPPGLPLDKASAIIGVFTRSGELFMTGGSQGKPPPYDTATESHVSFGSTDPADRDIVPGTRTVVQVTTPSFDPVQGQWSQSKRITRSWVRPVSPQSSDDSPISPHVSHHCLGPAPRRAGSMEIRDVHILVNPDPGGTDVGFSACAVSRKDWFVSSANLTISPIFKDGTVAANCNSGPAYAITPLRDRRRTDPATMVLFASQLKCVTQANAGQVSDRARVEMIWTACKTDDFSDCQRQKPVTAILPMSKDTITHHQ